MLQRLRHAVGWGLPTPPTGTRVDFQVCAPLGHGQTLWLVGDLPALGGSVDVVPTAAGAGVEGGLQLVTTPNLYPIWYNLEPVLAPAGSVVHYRYAVCSGSRFLRYEGSMESGEPITRNLTVGVGYVQRQDTLDAWLRDDETTGTAIPVTDAAAQTGQMENASGGEKTPSPAFWGVIPRLSSGQAFVDRRASVSEDGGGTLQHCNTSQQPPGSGRLLTDVVAENNEQSVNSTLKRESARLRGGEDVSSPVAKLRGGEDVSSPVAKLRAVSEDMPRSKLAPTSPKTTGGNVAMEATDGVIIAVHRLPVLVHRTQEGHYHIEWEDDNLICPSGLLKESYCDANWDRVSSMRLTWVGTVHCAETIPKEDEEQLAKQLEDFHCVPVFLAEPLSSTFQNFCYGTLWPVFHNIVDVYGALPTRWWNPGQQRNAWASYKTVNRIFVNKVIEVYNEGDLVWVHGLHHLSHQVS